MINLTNVSKTYGKTSALKDVSLNLNDNKIYCLLGRNGAGKTTLLKLIAGHIDADKGSISVNNSKVNTLVMPRDVNFIESGAGHFNMKIKDLIQGASILQDDFDIDFAMTMLNKFKLGENKKFKQLSFGMQTMISTLLSISSNAKIVIFDEPVLGFDAIMRDNFYTMLHESFENNPRIMIVSTHLIDEMAKVAEELIIIDKGTIILQTDMNEIDEKTYSVTGVSAYVEEAIKGLNVFNKMQAGGFITAYVYDKRIQSGDNVTVQSLGLQDFFIHLVGENN